MTSPSLEPRADVVAHWLSFAGEEGFRGACIIQCPEFLSAVSMAHFYGCNPGGEVRGMELDEAAMERATAIGYEPNTLYSKDDINRLDKAIRWPTEAGVGACEMRNEEVRP